MYGSSTYDGKSDFKRWLRQAVREQEAKTAPITIPDSTPTSTVSKRDQMIAEYDAGLARLRADFIAALDAAN
jgi:hypothetical protein